MKTCCQITHSIRIFFKTLKSRTYPAVVLKLQQFSIAIIYELTSVKNVILNYKKFENELCSSTYDNFV